MASSNKVKKLDPNDDILESTKSLANQIEHAWEQVQKFELPANLPEIQNVVVLGMGGSALGAHLILSLYGTKLVVPFLFISGYELPGFIGPNTVAILSSYSGTTEEVLSAEDVCAKRGAYTLGITIGGDLAKKMGKRAFVFNPKFNPSGHPRLGSGYMTFGLLGLLKKLGLTSVDTNEIQAATAQAQSETKKFLSSATNPARQSAKRLHGYNIVIVASEFLIGNAHVFANQLNETAKNFADYFTLPEINHHLMEGLKYPTLNKKNLKFVFIESDFYSPRLKLRYKITEEVVGKNGVRAEVIKLRAENKLSQVVELLVFSGFTSFYLATLNKVNAGDIKWVDYFKKRLS